ncbi:MAG TPA: COMM domain-containing protein [Polyangium sp.]|nr:COMM domain-containing protein [Polyangium sp.]
MTLPLFCLGGKPAPEAIVDDLKTLARLPERARARFWDALGPALPEPLPASVEATLDTFARAFEASPDDLARALKASRFLVREACARGLDRKRFEEDVVRIAGGPLSPEAAVIAPILLSRYDAVRATLGAASFRDTLTDHGAVLESIEWRLDAVLASSRGDAGAAKIAVLTLGYRDGDQKDRITLHLSPEKLEELRRACERMSS